MVSNSKKTVFREIKLLRRSNTFRKILVLFLDSKAKYLHKCILYLILRVYIKLYLIYYSVALFWDTVVYTSAGRALTYGSCSVLFLWL